MGVEVVHNQDDDINFRVDVVNENLDLVGQSTAVRWTFASQG